eukprot:Rhum_TRINITY_DN25411_c0_g1::Rhum_TRINITY_DN25411_c0_g1_i1::g.182068::m.182068
MGSGWGGKGIQVLKKRRVCCKRGGRKMRRQTREPVRYASFFHLPLPPPLQFFFSATSLLHNPVRSRSHRRPSIVFTSPTAATASISAAIGPGVTSNLQSNAGGTPAIPSCSCASCTCSSTTLWHSPASSSPDVSSIFVASRCSARKRSSALSCSAAAAAANSAASLRSTAFSSATLSTTAFCTASSDADTASTCPACVFRSMRRWSSCRSCCVHSSAFSRSAAALALRSSCFSFQTSLISLLSCFLCAPCDRQWSHMSPWHSRHHSSSSLPLCVAQHWSFHLGFLSQATRLSLCALALKSLCVALKHAASSQRYSFASASAGEQASHLLAAGFAQMKQGSPSQAGALGAWSGAAASETVMVRRSSSRCLFSLSFFFC